MNLEEQEKHINDIISGDDEIQIQKRLDPIIAKWITKYKADYPNVLAIYELARNCYLTGLLIDAQLAQIEIDKENK